MNVKGKSGVRWHPIFLCWCLNLSRVSPKAYDIIKQSGIQLLTRWTLNDYTQWVSAKPGFNHEVMFLKSSQPLQVIGQFLGELTYRDVTTRQTIYIVKTLRSNLLGLPAIETLKIATLNIHTIDDDSNQEDSLVKKSIRDKFPSLIQGLGNLREPYTWPFEARWG